MAEMEGRHEKVRKLKLLVSRGMKAILLLNSLAFKSIYL